MNEHYLDRVVARWLRDGPAGAPALVLEAALEHARTHPHRPLGLRLAGVIRGMGHWRPPLPGSRFAIVVSTTALVLAMVTFVWVAGRLPPEPPVPVATDPVASPTLPSQLPERTSSPDLTTCPPGTDPDAPGRSQQLRPRGNGVPADFDRDSGRVVAAFGYTIWTYDVCRNEWSRSATELPEVPRVAVHDPVLDLTVLIGQTVSMYDADTDTLEQRGAVPADLRDAVLRRTTNEIFAWDQWAATLWRYDAARDSWSEAPQGGDVPPLETSPLLAYDPSVDRLVLYKNTGLPSSYEFDFASATWQNSQPAPDLSLIWGDLGEHEMSYDEGLARSVAFSRGKVIAYDAATHTWEVLFDSLMEQATEGDPPDPTHRQGATLVYDPINGRLLAVGGHRRVGDQWHDNDDVLAFDAASRTWTAPLPTAHGAEQRSTAAPTLGSCPPGADPNEPGPPDQATPLRIGPVAFDGNSGRIVAIGYGSSDGTQPIPEGGRIWTFDVCTNTWSPTEASPYPAPRTAVYDPLTDLVVFFAGHDVFTYDTDTGALALLDYGDSPGGSTVFRSASGQVIVRDQNQLWEYEVTTDTWAQLPQSGDLPPARAGAWLLAYDAWADQLVAYVRDDQATESYTFSFGSYSWTRLEPDPPAVDFAYGYPPLGEIAYDEARSLTVVASGGRVVAFDESIGEWSILFEAQTARERRYAARYGAWLAYDSVNERIVVLGGGGPTVGPGPDVLAFDAATRTWRYLLDSPGGATP